MYRKIAEDLRHQIETGALPPGAQLRTELELREKYDASRNTVRDAIKWLITRSLVETRPGQGTFVVEKIVPFVTSLTGDPGKGRDDEGPIYIAEVEAARRRPTSIVPRVEIQQAVGVVQNELKLPDSSTVVSRHQQRYIDDIPFSLQTSFYPMSLVERGAVKLIQAANIDGGAVAHLGTTPGLPQPVLRPRGQGSRRRAGARRLAAQLVPGGPSRRAFGGGAGLRGPPGGGSRTRPVAGRFGPGLPITTS